MSDDEWGETKGPPIASIKKPETSSKNKDVFPVQYKYDRKIVKPVQRLESSVLPQGYVRSSHIGLIGVPGAGKSRFALQEILLAGQKGHDCLYLYNESSRDHFDNYIAKVADELKVSISDRITFCDMSEFILKIASYEGIESFFQRIWVQQVKYWLPQVKNPGFVAVDSFSNVARRYIPQMWESHQSFIDGLTALYSTLDASKRPVTLEVHQKSGSSYERDNDSVVGGFGLIHQLDTNIVFTFKNINNWDSKRYGIREGKKAYFMHIPKDRLGSGEFEQTQVVIKDGKMMLGNTIGNMVQEPVITHEVDWDQ
jgi:KaiC/GvpD/RAD55 family RecA-like ATPase